MLDHFFRPLVEARLRASLFGPWLDAYVVHLKERGNADKSIQRYVHNLEHFGCWLKRRRIKPTDIDRKIVRKFLQDHLPECRCNHVIGRQFRSNQLTNVRAALMHLLRLPAFADNSPPAPLSKTDALLEEYDVYLVEVAGLAKQTRRGRRRYARDFMKEFASRGSVNWAKLRPQDVANFFRRCIGNLRPKSIQRAASCVRGFLRFLRTTGRCDRDLTGAVPSIPKSSLASIPRHLSEKQLRDFLRQFKRRTPLGRRDYAMALCLVELGLRASEVAGLRLDDIDWRAGILRIVGGKSRRDRELPLPKAVGEAITVYLQKGRPKMDSRYLFVRHARFKGRAISTYIVSRAMGRALNKVPGYEHLKGAHVLRHSAATRLFQHGVPLKMVADLLGHLSIDTTQIYTKVDVPSLAKVALPWPEVQS